MNTLSLQYGNTAFPVSFDPSRFHVVAPPEAPLSPPQEFLIDSPPLGELAQGKRVLLIVSDLTRPTGSRKFLPPLLRTLDGAAKIALLFSTGLHRPLTAEDKTAIVGEDIFKAYPMLDHKPEEGNVYVGTTSRGNRVEIDSQVFDYDLIVLTGSIGFHYFAGFTGGRKSLLPGVASQGTIYFNHLLLLNQGGPGRNPEVRVARLEGNPVHEDMVEGVRLVDRPLFVYNTILDRNKKIEKTYQGDWLNAHHRAAEDYLAHHSVRLKGKRPLGIVSCGGFPRDINVIQSHKPLEFVQHAIEPGGTIVWLAECREGTGHASFFPWFRYSDLGEFERKLRENYQVYGQTAYSLLTKARRFRLILVSALERSMVEAMGLYPAGNLDEAMELAEKFAGKCSGYIFPFGADVLPAAVDV